MSAVRLGVAHAAAPTTDLIADRSLTASGPSPEALRLDAAVRIRLARTDPRSTDMYASHLINHELAHHRWQELSRQAQQARLARVVRAQRRARRAEQRATRAARSARLASQAALRAAERLV